MSNGRSPLAANSDSEATLPEDLLAETVSMVRPDPLLDAETLVDPFALAGLKPSCCEIDQTRCLPLPISSPPRNVVRPIHLLALVFALLAALLSLSVTLIH